MKMNGKKSGLKTDLILAAIIAVIVFLCGTVFGFVIRLTDIVLITVFVLTGVLALILMKRK